MDAPTVAVSDDGKKFAVGWMGTPGGKDRDVFWAVSSAGGQLPAEVLLPENPDGKQGHPSAGADASGVFYIAWEDTGGGSPGVWLLTSASGAKPERLSAADVQAAYPSVSAGKSVGVVWEQGGNAEFRKIK